MLSCTKINNMDTVTGILCSLAIPLNSFTVLLFACLTGPWCTVTILCLCGTFLLFIPFGHVGAGCSLIIYTFQHCPT